MVKLTVSGRGFDLLRVSSSSRLFLFLSGGLMPEDLTLTASGVLMIAGMVLVAFCRVENEDEFSTRMRLECLQWSVYVSYALLLAAFLFLYGWNFFKVMYYNMFTVLVVFILRFHWMLHPQKRFARHEK
jgi:hypothetical protein